jgi:maltose O-acetyltransferase
VIRSIKAYYWNLRHELKLLVLWFLCECPVGPGRWLRARLLPLFLGGLGVGTEIQHGFRVFTPEKVIIGAHCVMAQGVFITGGGGVTIGDWVGCGPDVKIWSVNHVFDDTERPIMSQGSSKKPVVIEDDVWLAANVMVLPGVTIGKGAVVAASSVVTRSIPAWAIAAGNPARVVGWRKRPDAVPSESIASDTSQT